MSLGTLCYLFWLTIPATNIYFKTSQDMIFTLSTKSAALMHCICPVLLFKF